MTTVGANNNGNATTKVPAWRVLLQSITNPSEYLCVDTNSRSGVQFFYHSFTFVSLLPVVIVCMVVIYLGTQFPDTFKDRDSIMFVPVLSVLLYGPVVLHVFSRWMLKAMLMVGLTTKSSTGSMTTVGWYIGAVGLCLVYWLLGVSVFFGNINQFFNFIDYVINTGILVILAVWLRIAYLGYQVNIDPAVATEGIRVRTRLIVGLMLGMVFSLLALLVIGFFVNLIAAILIDNVL